MLTNLSPVAYLMLFISPRNDKKQVFHSDWAIWWLVTSARAIAWFMLGWSASTYQHKNKLILNQKNSTSIYDIKISDMLSGNWRCKTSMWLSGRSAQIYECLAIKKQRGGWGRPPWTWSSYLTEIKIKATLQFPLLSLQRESFLPQAPGLDHWPPTQRELLFPFPLKRSDFTGQPEENRPVSLPCARLTLTAASRWGQLL